MYKMVSNENKVGLWAGVLFKSCEWKDNNGNARIDRDELSPAKAPSRDARPAATDIFGEIDKNGDGISLDEIRDYSQVKEKSAADIDTTKILDSLKNLGIYEDQHLPVIITDQNHILESLSLLPIWPAVQSNIDQGNGISLAVSLKNGRILGSRIKGAEKYSVVIFPDTIIQGQGKEIAAEALKHELVHVDQYLSGKQDEYIALTQLVTKRDDIEKNVRDFVETELERSLEEIEAYATNLESSLVRQDIREVKKNARLANYFISRLNVCRGIFQKLAKDDLHLVSGAFDEILPQQKADSINTKLAELAKISAADKDQFTIDRDISVQQHRSIYGTN